MKVRTMLPGDLDIRISVFEGSAPRISALMLYTRLLAAAAGGSSDRPTEYLILCRDASGCPPSWISQSEVSAPEVARLVSLLDAAGLPRRVPRVVVNDSLLGPGPYLALEARIGRRSASLNLPLQNAGFSGEDSGPLRAVFLHLAELAPPVRRPSVRDVLGRLVIDRAPAFEPGRLRGGAPIGFLGPGRPAGDAPAGSPFGAAGRDGPREAMPSFPRGALADR